MGKKIAKRKKNTKTALKETAMSKLTIKERNFIKYYIETGNATQAVMKAYDTTDYATMRSIGYENLTKPHLRDILVMLMDSKGISDGKLLNKLNDGLNAKRVVGNKDEFIEVDDHAVRHKFLETGLKLKGYLTRNNEQEGESAPANITINFRNQSLILSGAEAEHFPHQRGEV